MDKEDFYIYLKDNLDNIYRFAFSYVNDKETAEDVVSESVIKALDSIKSLKNPEYIQTWFFRIIINTAKTTFSKKKRIVLVESSDTEYQEYILPDHFDDYSYINFYDMLDSLTPEKRIVLVLRFYEDYKIKDIASILDINENTIKKRLYSALEELKSKYKGDDRFETV